MTAVIDKKAPPVEAAPDPIDTFSMPRPAIGQTVLWYPHGTPSEKPEVAIVKKLGHRNVVIGLAIGLNREAVRHVDDPKLSLSMSQRENGAWDFTDRDKQYTAILSRMEKLEAKCADLESLLVEPSKKK